MTQNKKVLIFLGDEKCHYCNIFKPARNIICQNDVISNSFHIIIFNGNGAVGRLQRDEIKRLLPRAFDNYNMLPTILIVSEEEYSRRWNLETGEAINDSLILTGVKYPGQIIKTVNENGVKRYVPDTENIVRWLLNNR